MSVRPLVTIVVPCRDAERWVGAALDSALAQTWPAVEVIAVNDGSRDGTMGVLRRYEHRGVRVLDGVQRGAGAARNLGLARARGRYLQYLDADDLLSPEKIAAQVEQLEGGPPGRVSVAPTVHFADGSLPDPRAARADGPAGEWDSGAEWLIELLGPRGRGSMVQTAAYLIPMDVARAAGPWQEFPSPDDDGEYFTRVALASSGIVRSSEGFTGYRQHARGRSLRSRETPALQWGALRSLDLRAAALRAVADTPLARRALATAYMERAVLAYPDHPDVSTAALARVRALGGTAYVPQFGSWKGELVRRCLGWKAARWLSVRWWSRPTMGAT